MLNYTVLDWLIRETILKKVHIQKVVSRNPSNSTDSIYYILEDTKGKIYGLSFSDHESFDRLGDVDELFDDSKYDVEQLSDELNPDTNDYNDLIESSIYYGINSLTTPYKLCPKDLIGKLSTERAFISDSIKVQSAELKYHDKVLHVIYSDLNNNDYEEEDYINHDIRFGSMQDIASINYLVENYNVHAARKLYYQESSPVRLMSEKEYRQNLYDNLMEYYNPEDEENRQEKKEIEQEPLNDLLGMEGEIYCFNNKNYIIRQEDLEESEYEARIN